MGREIGQKCVRNIFFVSRFSIFFCGCKQPKSIHIYFSAAKIRKIERRAKKIVLFFCRDGVFAKCNLITQ